MLEAIALCERISGRQLDYTLSDEARIGDHRWWISDLDAFKRDHPDWRLQYGIEQVLQEIHDFNVERWTAQPGARA
jgi:CDP-paratose 2-epimerase